MAKPKISESKSYSTRPEMIIIRLRLNGQDIFGDSVYMRTSYWWVS